MSTATKRDPKKWAAAKAKAKAKMGGKWSARAAQLAVILLQEIRRRLQWLQEIQQLAF